MNDSVFRHRDHLGALAHEVPMPSLAHATMLLPELAGDAELAGLFQRTRHRDRATRAALVDRLAQSDTSAQTMDAVLDVTQSLPSVLDVYGLAAEVRPRKFGPEMLWMLTTALRARRAFIQRIAPRPGWVKFLRTYADLAADRERFTSAVTDVDEAAFRAELSEMLVHHG